MEQEDLWKQFAVSGRIEDYLAFARQVEADREEKERQDGSPAASGRIDPDAGKTISRGIRDGF